MITPQPEPTCHERAISQLARLIKDSPDTSGGVQLRKFLWSLYNMHHAVNLWTFASRIGEDLAEPVADILRAALAGELQESDVKRGLLLAGEFGRWDATAPDNDTAARVEEAIQALSAAALRTPPCYEHVEFQRILHQLERLRDQALRNS